MSKILVSSRYFIPEKDIDVATLKKKYAYRRFDEQTCKMCKVYRSGKRYNKEDCAPCDAYLGVVKLWRKAKFEGKSYIGLPVGNPKGLEANFGINLSKVKDHRAYVPMEAKLKFTQKLYDGSPVGKKKTADQKGLVKLAVQALRKDHAGILQSPPRSGKSSMAVAITVELGQRTLILANKEDLLLQFKGTFEGSDKYPAFTNAKEEEFRLGRPVVKIVKTIADFKRAETADIVLVLYQKFVRDGSIDRIYDFLIDKFGLVIVDEVHRGSADGFAKILLRINPAYRLGLSATPNNKNKNRRKLLKESMGKVVARSTSVSLPTRVEVFETGVTISKPHKLWVYAIKYLSSKFERNKMIVQEVFKDLRAGRKGILIPVQFKDHIQELTDLINNQADYNNRNKDEDWPMPLCVPYTGALTPNKKEQYKNAIDTGEAKVMVSINSMITEGIDLSNPDTLYQVIPMSGDKEVGAPIFQQLSFRVATFTPTKVDPVIKVFVDALPQSFYCFRSLMTTEVFPRLGNEYLMNKYDVARAKEIIDEVNQTRAYIPPNPAGKRIFSREVVEGVDEFGGNKVKATHKKKKKTIAKDGLRKTW